jgi:hypothetical protein
VSSGRYRLDPTVATDVDLLAAAVGVEQQAARLMAIAGPPFQATTGYEWAFGEGLVDSASSTIAAIATTVGKSLIDVGEFARAERVIRSALGAVPGDGRLYDCLAEGRRSRGDVAGITRLRTEHHRVMNS